MTALNRLIEAVEAGGVGLPLRVMPDELADLASFFQGAFHGSFDDAIVVKDALTPEYDYVVCSNGFCALFPKGIPDSMQFDFVDPRTKTEANPVVSRALLLATLKAYRETPNDK